MRPLIVLAGLALAWGLICAFYWFRQEAVIFQPTRLPADHAYRFDRPFEEHRIPVAPGVELSALWFSSARDTVRGAVLYLHGNAGSLQDWGWHADLYVEQGYDFLVVDYRGYGKSDGRIRSEEELHEDVARTWDWLLERHPPGDVTIVGYSLGSALAVRLACTRDAPPERVVLLAPFTSVEDIARRTVPFVPIGILRYPLRTDRHLSDCPVPVTIFHGANDRTIPFSHGRRLAEIGGSNARLVPLPDAGHQDVAGDPAFRREMRALLGGRFAVSTP